MKAAIRAAGAEGDSVGGMLETAILGLPAGVGEPVLTAWRASWPTWRSPSRLSRASSSVPASALPPCAARGQRRLHDAGDRIATATNKNAGINGGITNGMPVVFRTALKPTPSIYKAAGYGGLYRQKGRATVHSGPP